MPHLIIEYAHDAISEAQAPLLLDIVHHAAINSRVFEVSHIRTRLVRVNHYRVGTDSKPFIHAQLRIKPGRTTDQKKALSEAVLAALKVQQTAVRVITVEVVEMVPETYSKYEA